MMVMFVCMCIDLCMWVCVHACMHAWVCVCVHEYMCANSYNSMECTSTCEPYLRVKESSHPEAGRPSIKEPGTELTVTIQQVSEPETQCGGLP